MPIKGPNKAYLRKYGPLPPSPYPPKGPYDKPSMNLNKHKKKGAVMIRIGSWCIP